MAVSQEKCCRIRQTKLILFVFIFQENIPKQLSREGPTPSKVSKDLTGLRITLASRLTGLPREAPRLSTICKKGQCKSFGSALCRHGLRHVDFCQAHFYLKHALSSPLIYSSQATEIFPLQPKACMPPQLTEVDISNWRTPQQTHLKTPQPFLQR